MRRPGIKNKSARQTLHQKHKIERKVREHNRKQRKALKKGQALNKGSRFSKRTRDPGIPASCPFRDEVLKEAQAFKEKQEIEKAEMAKKQQKWQQLQFKRKQMGFSSVDAMLEKAEADRIKHEKKEREKIEDLEAAANSSQCSAADLAKGKRESQNFWRQVNKVINEADIILHIMDARDPEGTRCKQIEKAVKNADKKLVLVLNKIDLIPLEAAKAWLKFYRRTMGPCISFKATTQTQRSNISQKGSGGKMAKEVSGTSAMLNYLANYGRLESEDKTSKVRTAVTVGVVGLPNTGKSSIINTLKRNKSCQVGNKPGVTRSIQTVQIDSHVKLIDSPGVVIEVKDRNSIVGQVLLHASEVGSAENAREAALEILKRCGDLENMAFHYQMEYDSKIIDNNPEHFLACLAKRKGFLKKGARPDVNAACKFLLREWTCGKLNYHTLPPQMENAEGMEAEENTSLSKYGAKIKSFLGDELDIDMLAKSEDDDQGVDEDMDTAGATSSSKINVLFRVPENKTIEYKVDIKASGSRKRKIQFDDENMEDDAGQGKNSSPASSSSKKPAAAETNADLKHLGQVPEKDEFDTMFTDKNKKKMMKKRKKMLKRSNMEMSQVADDLSSMMENA